jgi:hypothetical protein
LILNGKEKTDKCPYLSARSTRKIRDFSDLAESIRFSLVRHPTKYLELSRVLAERSF